MKRHTCAACGDIHVCVTEESAIGPIVSQRIDAGRIVIDMPTRSVTFDGEVIDGMKRLEFDLLARLAALPRGRVVTREWLLDAVWGPDFHGDERTVDVHVTRIRRAIEDASDRKLRGKQIIQSVHGVGYRFCPLIA